VACLQSTITTCAKQITPTQATSPCSYTSWTLVYPSKEDSKFTSYPQLPVPCNVSQSIFTTEERESDQLWHDLMLASALAVTRFFSPC